MYFQCGVIDQYDQHISVFDLDLTDNIDLVFSRQPISTPTANHNLNFACHMEAGLCSICLL